MSSSRGLRAMGIRDRPISPRAPWQNGYSERLIGSDRERYIVASVASRRLRSVDEQSNGRSGARSHPATEADGRNSARSEIHTTAETRSSGLRINPSTQYRRHDCRSDGIVLTMLSCSANGICAICSILTKNITTRFVRTYRRTVATASSSRSDLPGSPSCAVQTAAPLDAA